MYDTLDPALQDLVHLADRQLLRFLELTLLGRQLADLCRINPVEALLIGI